MSCALYVDVNVHRAITDGLRRRGHDVLTAQEDGSATLADSILLDRVRSLRRIIFTMDVDFLEEAASRLRLGRPFATVVYIAQRKAVLARCIDDLAFIADAISDHEATGQIVYLPL